MLGLKGPIKVQREINPFNDFLIGFFDQHLVKPDSALLDAAVEEYNEVEFEEKR
jgi:hypothetical protein